MDKKQDKAIFTTLPYVNSKPHIGHAFEFILADIITRFYRATYGKENVFFNTGIIEGNKYGAIE